jgi:hypothetical protein
MTADDARFLMKPVGLCRDKRLTSIESDYLCLIAQLHKGAGCTASNQYFADYFGVARTTAVEVISSLRRKQIISTTEKKSGGKTIERTITITDADSREILLSNSRDSRPKRRPGIVGSSDRDSRKSPNHTIEATVEYDSNNKRLRNITPKDIQLWKKTYPLLDIEGQLRKMETWLDANPAKRPRSNYKRFIVSWLAREKPEAGGYVPREIDEAEAETILQQIGAE